MTSTTSGLIESSRASTVRLHVNIDHVATLRNARGTVYPDPVEAARACLQHGAVGITAHLREDRRHIKDDDVRALRTAFPSTTLNLEMAATDEMVGIALAVMPDVVTLVPERREERTTEGGLDVILGGVALANRIAKLRAARLKVSLFIAADDAQIRSARALDAEQIELHTGEYAHAYGDASKSAAELERLARGTKLGVELGLEVAAGHGLTCENVVAVAAIDGIVELNIGHAIVSDSVMLGIGEATRRMADAIMRGASQS